MRIACDIAVIGLGPAGASAAAAATASGLSVVGVDRKAKAGVPVQCAELVPALLGAEAPVATTAAQPITAMHTHVGADWHEQPNFPGHIISRADFDAELVARARQAGAEISLGCGVTHVSQDGEISLGDGRVLAPRLIIAADGPRSAVGAAVGQANTRFVETRQITAPLLKPHEATDIFLSDALPGGYGWLFPKGAVANIGVGVDARYRARLKLELERLHAELVKAGRVGPQAMLLTGGAIPAGGMRYPTTHLGERPVLLAGDAAGLANPITGAGIAAAVISGRMAGEAAAEWGRGRAAAIYEYAEDVRDLFGPALERALNHRAELLAHYEAGGTPPHAALRRGWIAFPEYWNDALENAHVLHQVGDGDAGWKNAAGPRLQ